MTDIDLTRAIIHHDSDELREAVDEDARRVMQYLEGLDYNLVLAQAMLYTANHSPIIFALRDIRRKGQQD